MLFFSPTNKTNSVNNEFFKYFTGIIEFMEKVVGDFNRSFKDGPTYIITDTLYVTKNILNNPVFVKLNTISYNYKAVHFLDQEIFNPSEHVFSAQFRILRGVDLEDYKLNRLGDNKIPQIAVNEPCVKYYNGKAGDITESISKVIIPGFMVEYKTVYRTVKHPFEKKAKVKTT
jgi:DNA-directed RNA polymerase subunit H (RpoH/RPB5)